MSVISAAESQNTLVLGQLNNLTDPHTDELVSALVLLLDGKPIKSISLRSQAKPLKITSGIPAHQNLEHINDDHYDPCTGQVRKCLRIRKSTEATFIDETLIAERAFSVITPVFTLNRDSDKLKLELEQKVDFNIPKSHGLSMQVKPVHK